MQEKVIANEPSGVLIFDKPEGITSQTAVNIARRVFCTRRVGHTGTLDPLATGVLVILVGNAVKASELLSHDTKSYDAVVRLGITTDTEDVTGRIETRYSGSLPDIEKVRAVLPDFCGDIMQVPPMYSALKRDGKKLCDLAREGKVVEREQRPINISSLEVSPAENSGEYRLSVACSKGTYIRTLCADIGKALGCGGAMASLRRTSCGGFTLADAVSEEKLKSAEHPEELLIPTEKLFYDLRKVVLPQFYSRLARCGNEIYIRKIGLCAEEKERFCVYDDGGKFICVSECERFEDGLALKCVKMF